MKNKFEFIYRIRVRKPPLASGLYAPALKFRKKELGVIDERTAMDEMESKDKNLLPQEEFLNSKKKMLH